MTMMGSREVGRETGGDAGRSWVRHEPCVGGLASGSVGSSGAGAAVPARGRGQGGEGRSERLGWDYGQFSSSFPCVSSLLS